MIQAVPSGVASRLQAGAQVAGLSQAIAELCANAIDAHASHITVTMDMSSLSATVEDDGDGILPASFQQLGLRGCSSKDTASGSLGFRGQALASLAELAVVQVT